MDFVKISVETYTNKKMEIEQLVVVLRTVSIGKAKTLENWRKTVLKVPIHLSLSQYGDHKI